MKFYFIISLLTLSPFTTTTASHRRILHHPFFPATSSPPPFATSDNPFFHETTPDQPQSPPTPLPPPYPPTVTAAQPLSPAPAKNSGKKITVGISVGIVILGMILVLVFFIYKHKRKQQRESGKLVGGNNEGSPEIMPPVTFFNIGTSELSRTGTESTNGTSVGSPYHKLNSVKVSDRYRPSPELQPLPPLSKPAAAVVAAAVMNSDDDEVEKSNDFYTPNGSVTRSRSRLSVSYSPETLSEKHIPASQPPLPTKYMNQNY